MNQILAELKPLVNSAMFHDFDISDKIELSFESGENNRWNLKIKAYDHEISFSKLNKCLREALCNTNFITGAITSKNKVGMSSFCTAIYCIKAKTKEELYERIKLIYILLRQNRA